MENRENMKNKGKDGRMHEKARSVTMAVLTARDMVYRSMGLDKRAEEEAADYDYIDEITDRLVQDFELDVMTAAAFGERSMTAMDKVVFLLKGGEMTIEEIAEAVGKTASAVYMTISRCGRRHDGYRIVKDRASKRYKIEPEAEPWGTEAREPAAKQPGTGAKKTTGEKPG